MALLAAVTSMLATATVAIHSPSLLRLSRSGTETTDGPKWVLHPRRGQPFWSCGEASWDSTAIPECGREGDDMFSDAGVLSLPGFNLTSVAHRVDWLAETKCSITFSGNLQPQSPFRVVVDGMFENSPRCCTSTQDLCVSDDGSVPPFWDTVQHDGVVSRIDPAEHKCTTADKCALVLEFAGAAGIPWLMFQNSCPSCNQTLHSVLISPVSCLEEGCLHTDVIPVVRSIIANDETIDAEKAYIVSTSKGNENAFKAALHYPDMFKVVAMTGQFSWELAGFADWTEDTIQSIVDRGDRKLVSLQFHIGDSDINQGPDWWTDLTNFATRWPLNTVMLERSFAVDVHIYPEAEHPAWYATWNSLHESIWLGMPFDSTNATGTCMGIAEAEDR